MECTRLCSPIRLPHRRLISSAEQENYKKSVFNFVRIKNPEFRPFSCCFLWLKMLMVGLWSLHSVDFKWRANGYAPKSIKVYQNAGNKEKLRLSRWIESTRLVVFGLHCTGLHSTGIHRRLTDSNGYSIILLGVWIAEPIPEKNLKCFAEMQSFLYNNHSRTDSLKTTQKHRKRSPKNLKVKILSIHRIFKVFESKNMDLFKEAAADLCLDRPKLAKKQVNLRPKNDLKR